MWELRVGIDKADGTHLRVCVCVRGGMGVRLVVPRNSSDVPSSLAQPEFCLALALALALACMQVMSVKVTSVKFHH